MGKGKATILLYHQIGVQPIEETNLDCFCNVDQFEEQMRLYPNAKVLLTVRDTPASWVKSYKVLMDFIQVQETPFSIVYPTFIQWFPFMRNWKIMRNMMGTQIGLAPGELIRGWRTKADPDAFLAECYEKHNENVRNTVSAEQFLEFNVKQGWAPLCAFLDVPIPQDEPFPFVNESDDIETAKMVMKVLSYAWLPAVMSCVSYLLSQSK